MFENNTITYIPAPAPKLACEEIYDLVSVPARVGLDIYENSVVSLGRSIDIRNCLVQKNPTKRGTIRVSMTKDGSYDVFVSYRSKKFEPITLEHLSATEVTAWFNTTAGVTG